MHKRMSLSAIESDNKMAALLLATSIYPIKFIIIIKIFINELSLSLIIIFCFVFITIDQIKALNFYFYIKTTFRSLLHLQVKDYTNFE